MRSSEDSSADERLLNENPRWPPTFVPKPQREKRWKIWAVAAACLLAGFVLGAFGHRTGSKYIEAHFHEADTHNASAPSSPSSGNPQKVDEWGVPLGIPTAMDTPTTFEPNGTYSEIDPEEKTNDVWKTLMPPGRGFVQVKPNGDGIPHDSHKSTPENLKQTKVVSVFHQIHCLNTLRRALYTSMNYPREFPYLIPQMGAHWQHCFDYLRQALMCTADTTLEKLESDGDNLLASVAGWGTEHKCKDYRAVMEWAEEMRGTDDIGID